MPELSAEDRESLAAFAAVSTPSADATKAALARVRQRVAEGEIVDVPEDDVTPPRSAARPWLKVAVVGLAVAAAVVLVLRSDLSAMLAAEADPADSGAAAVHTQVADTGPDGQAIAAEPPVPAPKAKPKPEPAPSVGAAAVPPEEEVAPEAAPPQPKKPKVKRRQQDATLHAELALLRPAQQALRAGNHARALTLFNNHARSFPKSALAEERSLGRIEALCGLGRTSEAARRIRSFVRAYPGSPLRGRAKAACPRKDAP